MMMMMANEVTQWVSSSKKNTNNRKKKMTMTKMMMGTIMHALPIRRWRSGGGEKLERRQVAEQPSRIKLG